MKNLIDQIFLTGQDYRVIILKIVIFAITKVKINV